MYDVAIIGCGVIGAATAYQLAGRGVSVLMLEAENDVAMGTTKANSAILHAGYDPEPGTQMAYLNVRGSAMAKEICQLLDVPYQQIGSLVLAFSEEEMDHVRLLCQRGEANGVPGVRVLSKEETLAMEPNLSDAVCGALLAPSAAVVSPWEYALAMAENAVVNGAQLKLETRVTGLEKQADSWLIHTNQGDEQARFVVNAAGVQAGHIHEMAAPKTFTTTPCRGEYYLLDKAEGSRVNHVIFQCPTKVGKGILVSPTVHGNLIVGPNAENIPDEGNTANTAAGLAFVGEMARKSVPEVNLRASIRNFAGIRANTDQKDFVIDWAAPGLLDLAGMKSPGLSAAAAVGEKAAQMLKEKGLALGEDERKITTRKKFRFKECTAQEKARLIEKDPAYGKIICRCETITEGEILAACRTPIKPRSIDAVKRRTNAGMGRCQGGFCGPRVMEILVKELGMDPLAAPQDQAGATVLVSKTKQGGSAQ